VVTISLRQKAHCCATSTTVNYMSSGRNGSRYLYQVAPTYDSCWLRSLDGQAVCLHGCAGPGGLSLLVLALNLQIVSLHMKIIIAVTKNICTFIFLETGMVAIGDVVTLGGDWEVWIWENVLRRYSRKGHAKLKQAARLKGLFTAAK